MKRVMAGLVVAVLLVGVTGCELWDSEDDHEWWKPKKHRTHVTNDDETDDCTGCDCPGWPPPECHGPGGDDEGRDG